MLFFHCESIFLVASFQGLARSQVRENLFAQSQYMYLPIEKNVMLYHTQGGKNFNLKFGHDFGQECTFSDFAQIIFQKRVNRL